MPYGHRKRVFLFFLTVFIVSMPIVMFYTNGYRFDFSNDRTQIVSTGGLFIGVSDRDAEVFVNDELEQDLRVFRQATYVQNLEAGVHKVHVQQEGFQTWVKELPVQPFIVTEAQSFLMPLVPQVRLIAEYENTSGAAVVQVPATTTPVLPHASTTNTVIATTSSATSTLNQNTEYLFVQDLFATTSATTSETLIDRVADQIEDVFEFGGATSSATSSVPEATTTKEWRDMRLFEKDGEVYAKWIGLQDEIPSYFCVNHVNATTTARDYGAHVAEAIVGVIGTDFETPPVEVERVCREEIRVDRKWQEVRFFDFFPDSTDLVLMHLDDGLHVVEVDDRGWQNTQILYPGENIEVRLDGGRIYVKDGSLLLEVLTEIPS